MKEKKFATDDPNVFIGIKHNHDLTMINFFYADKDPTSVVHLKNAQCTDFITSLLREMGINRFEYRSG